MTNSYSKQKEEMVDWISQFRFNTYLTVTLKQAVPGFTGFLHRINKFEAIKTARKITDRLTRKFLGTRLFGKKRQRLNCATFIEGEDTDKRMHLHILFERPPHISIEKLRVLLNKVCAKLLWVHHIVDARDIYNPGTGEKFLTTYSLKEGIDSFCPEASTLVPKGT